MTAPAIAFFDVDETVVDLKTMFSFLRFHLACAGDDGSGYDRAAGALFDMSRRGVDRCEVNRAYYRNYVGSDWDTLYAEGRAWAMHTLDDERRWIPSATAELARHRRNGDHVVLVSGSFRPCLVPIATRLGAHRIECSEPVLDTGAVETPMIGTAKADAVRKVAADNGIDPSQCFAYGDHVSDLPMLEAVGYPTFVGDDAVLGAIARERGWPILSTPPCLCGCAVAEYSAQLDDNSNHDNDNHSNRR